MQPEQQTYHVGSMSGIALLSYYRLQNSRLPMPEPQWRHALEDNANKAGPCATTDPQSADAEF